MNQNIRKALICLGRVKADNPGKNNTELAIKISGGYNSELYHALVLLFNETETAKPVYGYRFRCAIDDIKARKETGVLANGHISAIAKKHGIKVTDLKTILKDEGIIQ